MQFDMCWQQLDKTNNGDLELDTLLDSAYIQCHPASGRGLSHVWCQCGVSTLNSARSQSSAYDWHFAPGLAHRLPKLAPRWATPSSECANPANEPPVALPLAMQPLHPMRPPLVGLQWLWPCSSQVPGALVPFNVVNVPLCPRYRSRSCHRASPAKPDMPLCKTSCNSAMHNSKHCAGM